MEEGNQQFMAARIDENLPQGIEYSDLFELDDPALEAELQLLEGPISESPQELRRLQQSADQNGGVPTPAELVETWFKVDGKKRHPYQNQKYATYANAVKTRYGVSGSTLVPALRDPLGIRQSPRIAKRVHFVEPSAATKMPVSHVAPLKEGRRGNYGQQQQRKATPSPPVSPRATISKRRKIPPDGGEMFVDDDEVQLPMTFPLTNMGEPTPGTTHLDEPPEGEIPAPTVQLSVSPDRQDEPLVEIPLAATTHPLTVMRSLCRHIGSVQDQANAIETIMYDMAKAEEEMAPLPSLVVHQSHTDNMITEKYYKAQKRNRMKFSMATLITNEGQLQADGVTPRIAICWISSLI